MPKAIKTMKQKLGDAVTEKAAKKREMSFPLLTELKHEVISSCMIPIASAINELLSTGLLSTDLQMSICASSVEPKDLNIDEFTPWRILQREFVCDVVIKTSLQTQPEVYEDFYFQCAIGASLDKWGEFDISDLTIFNGVWPERIGVKLDSYGLPLFNRQDIPGAAVDIWDLWHPDALVEAYERKPMILAEKMNLHVKKRKIHGCKDQDFILFFEADTILVDQEKKPWEKKAPPPLEESFEPGTIVINMNVPQADGGDLTIYEACFSYYWHYIFYWIQGCKTTDKRAFKMKPVKEKETRKNPLNHLWLILGGMELMLPRYILQEKITADSNKAREQKPELGLSNHQGVFYQNLANIIAADFGLKPFRVKQRLIEIGRIAAKGALNWEPDIRNYVPPFATSDMYTPMDKDEVFFITRQRLAKLYQESEELRKKLMTGDYVHVDGLLCLNDPAFVQIVYYNLDKTAHLTAWANAHINECCLSFKKSYPEDGNYAVYEYRPDWNDTRLEETMRLRLRKTKAQLEEEKKEYLSIMPTNIHEALRFLMINNPRRRLDPYRLADESCFPLSTISSFLQSEGAIPSFFDLVNLCIGMNLPSWISEALMKMIGTDLPRDGVYSVWGQLFDCYCLLSVKDAKNYINIYTPRPKDKATDDETRKAIYIRQVKGA